MIKSNKMRMPIVTILLFAFAIGLLLFTSVGGTRAALIEGTDENAYELDIGMPIADILLYEQCGESAAAAIADNGTLLSGLEGTPEPGRSYAEKLWVVNGLTGAEQGNFDQFVRVQVYTYWLDEDGNKDPSLDPSLIELTLGGNGWVEDTSAAENTSNERRILYYTSALKPGQASQPFCEALSVSTDVLLKAEHVTTSSDGTYTETAYVYDGKQFCIEVEADGVQVVSGQAAVQSAWGCTNVTVDEDAGTLSLN